MIQNENNLYVLLFSNHVWYTCYEPKVDEFITTYKWEHDDVSSVILISPKGERREIKL